MSVEIWLHYVSNPFTTISILILADGADVVFSHIPLHIPLPHK